MHRVRSVLAFSGGLDTSFCVPWLARDLRPAVVTVTVDTGGIDAAAAESLARARARARRARTTSCVDAPRRLLRAGAAVPDHGQRAARPASIRCASAPSACCRRRRSRSAARGSARNVVAHGCTAAGNDQVRFEVALRTLAPELEILAPVRDQRVQARRAAGVPARSAACPCRRSAPPTRSTAASGA